MENITPSLLRFWMSPRYISVCRLCLTETSEWSSLDRPLYIRTVGYRGTMTVKSLLVLLFQTKNYEDKSYPQYVCESCLENVLKFFSFWQQCRNTESVLKKQAKALYKRVAILYSNVTRNKKSQYNNEKAVILHVNSKKIEYLNYVNRQNDDVKQYLNRDVSQTSIKGAYKNEEYNAIKSVNPLKYQCDYCNDSFVQKDPMIHHLKVYHKIFDIAECINCGQKFKSIQLLKRHSAKHKQSNYKCIICKESFTSTAKLESHAISEHKDYTFKCLKCQQIFKRERDLSIHNFNTHRSGYEYYCKVCGKKFRNYYSVKSHEEAHEGYSCDNCSQRFNSKIRLKQHLVECLQISTSSAYELDKYVCDICTKTFFRKATLRQHILNLHLFPKRYQCSRCEKKVSTKNQLEAHMVVHTRERKDQCDICKNYFVTKYALTYHMRLHTGERPYPCGKCDEKFLSASRRMAHIKRKHIGRTEQCNVCSKRFYSGYALRRHMQRHFDPNSTLYENVCS